ncbi:dihydrofolate reductase family protein [Micromonospora sp. DR5-3]|uniref:dihydrofolate reductase family protein n=1 Tax=unclassified Micromonospora TaxID=2617518 RepID=UPI0011D46BCD|nr:MULTISPECIES: dihydrofolate reductase family protein [unclassified Micromonospora]MCW3815565.1 dihydrofolate reductase family protein [Micromonospora sp. DR5-3]TYC19810.1 dihydrofolate reductase [Micromonospora sp. MP36]
MKLVVVEWMSLDGVVQAPGAPDEDPSGGFAHGGWHLRWFDDTSRQWVVDNLNAASAFLFGRSTYERFAAHWPHVTGPERVVADPLNSKPKFVVSSTLAPPLTWAHSSLLTGEAIKAVAGLRESGDGELHVIGSARLAQTLIAHDLVDELRLMVDPVLLGGGKRIWPQDGRLASFRLADAEPTSTGALLLSYVRA